MSSSALLESATIHTFVRSDGNSNEDAAAVHCLADESPTSVSLVQGGGIGLIRSGRRKTRNRMRDGRQWGRHVSFQGKLKTIPYCIYFILVVADCRKKKKRFVGIVSLVGSSSSSSSSQVVTWKSFRGESINVVGATDEIRTHITFGEAIPRVHGSPSWVGEYCPVKEDTKWSTLSLRWR